MSRGTTCSTISGGTTCSSISGGTTCSSILGGTTVVPPIMPLHVVALGLKYN
jgi:hypothetical protein